MRLTLCVLERDRLVDDRAGGFGVAEHVDHVDAARYLGEGGVTGLAEDLLAGGARVDRDHAVTLDLQVLHGEVAGPVPIGAGADHGDVAHAAQDAAQVSIAIVQAAVVRASVV